MTFTNTNDLSLSMVELTEDELTSVGGAGNFDGNCSWCGNSSSFPFIEAESNFSATTFNLSVSISFSHVSKSSSFVAVG